MVNGEDCAIFIFLNGAIVEESKGLLNSQDRGFLYGDGIFETFRTYNKKPFRLEAHVARLVNSAQHFGIPFHYTFQQVSQIIEQLLDVNKLHNAYFRMTLSRGIGGGGIIPSDGGSPTFVVHAKPLIPYPPSLYETGVSLTVSQIRRSASCPLSGHKTLNFLVNYLVKKEAVDCGAHDALMLNTDNHITECAVSNVFIVEKNTVITPSLSAGVLPGITRKVILDLCRENTIPACEELFGLERVFHADEVFITNSLMEVMPVSKVDGRMIGISVPGVITGILRDKYKALTL
jgi:branched-chain amino acid aminotransferase